MAAPSGYVWLQHIARCMTGAACSVEGCAAQCSTLGAGVTLRSCKLCTIQPANSLESRPEWPIWHAEGASGWV